MSYLFDVVLMLSDVGIGAVMVPRIVGVMTSDVVLRAPCILRRWGITGCAIGREDVIQGYTPLFMGENHYSNFKQCHRIYTSHN